MEREQKVRGEGGGEKDEGDSENRRKRWERTGDERIVSLVSNLKKRTITIEVHFKLLSTTVDYTKISLDHSLNFADLFILPKWYDSQEFCHSDSQVEEIHLKYVQEEEGRRRRTTTNIRSTGLCICEKIIAIPM